MGYRDGPRVERHAIVCGLKIISRLCSAETGAFLRRRLLNNSAVKIWETATGRELRSIVFEEGENLAAQDSIALSPDGSLLAALTETVKGSMQRRSKPRCN